MICNGRLTLISCVAETYSDVAGAALLYFTPRDGNRIALWSATAGQWCKVVFAEMSLDPSGLGDGLYDIFGYLAAGALALEWGAAWTDEVTRAGAIGQQDGVDVKAADATRRLLGTVKVVSGLLNDSQAKRWVSNRYNTITRHMVAAESTDSWSYGTATYRQANANAANQLDFVCCVPRLVQARAVSLGMQAGGGNQNVSAGIGIDSTTVNSAQIICAGNTGSGIGGYGTAEYRGAPGLGRHTLKWLEWVTGGGFTMYGDAGVPDIVTTGISGLVEN